MATPVDVLRRMIGVDYDGANGQELADIFGWTVVSDNGTTLVLSDGVTPNRTITLGQYLIYVPEIPGIAGPDFQGITDTLGEIWARISDLTTPVAHGSEAVSGSLLGQNGRVFDMTLSRPMPDTSYTPIVSMATGIGVLGLGGHAVTAVSVLDVQTVRVTLNSSAASPAGIVQVIALG